MWTFGGGNRACIGTEFIDRVVKVIFNFYMIVINCFFVFFQFAILLFVRLRFDTKSFFFYLSIT